MPLRLDDLAALDAPVPAANGQPLQLAIDDIDEDPEQPRREFDAHALQELAATIRERGVRQPISVRHHPRDPDRWLLNFGARRLRAGKLAGLTEIPAFIDTTADRYDQVIENEQRERLRPLELSLFVQKRIAQGDTQAEIARRLGKSRQWVTLATALIDPPDWLLQAYRVGRCTGLAELYELRRLHDERGDAVRQWAEGVDHITRQRVTALKAQLAGGGGGLSAGASVDETRLLPSSAKSPEQAPAAPTVAAPAPVPDRSSPPAECPGHRLHVGLDGEDFQLVLDAVPAEAGHLYVRPLAGGTRRLAPAGSIRLRGFVDR